jgi:hypothetical protein
VSPVRRSNSPQVTVSKRKLKKTTAVVAAAGKPCYKSIDSFRSRAARSQVFTVTVGGRRRGHALRAGFSDKRDVTKIMKIITSIVVALVLSLTLVTAAFGQSSVNGYSNQAGQVQSDVEGVSAQPVATNNSGGGGSLPFTGLDVALLVGAGGVLVVAGLGMRRLTRSPGSA